MIPEGISGEIIDEIHEEISDRFFFLLENIEDAIRVYDGMK